MVGQRAEIDTICIDCHNELKSMKCHQCGGKGVKGIFSRRECEECGGTGRMTLCLNARCSFFDKRLYGWFAAQQRGFR